MKQACFAIGVISGLGVFTAIVITGTAMVAAATLVCRQAPRTKRVVQRLSEDVSDTVAELRARGRPSDPAA
jgi:hypothetical protein